MEKRRICIKNGRIHNGIVPEVLEGDILLKDGKIEAIGKDLAVDEATEILDVEGKEIYPGFVEAHGHIGLDGYGIGYEGMDYNELNDIVTQQGGTVFASAAIVASHSIVSRLAAGRPNALDKQNIAAFARFAKQKLQRGDDNVVSVPGKRPYRSWSKPPVAPVLIGQCVHCGLCVRQCPVQAIDPRDPSKTDPDVCIMCMRCIRICTQGAKALPAPVQQATEAMLSKYMDVIRENEYFI